MIHVKFKQKKFKKKEKNMIVYQEFFNGKSKFLTYKEIKKD